MIKCNGISPGKVLCNCKMLLRDLIHKISPPIKQITTTTIIITALVLPAQSFPSLLISGHCISSKAPCLGETPNLTACWAAVLGLLLG